MEKTNKMHIVIKSIWQIFLVFFEICIVVGILVYASNKIFPITETFECIERAFMFYAFYQIITFLILNTINDVDKDSYLALKTNYKIAELFCETKEIGTLNYLKANIEYQLNNQTFNKLSVRQEYKNLSEYIKNEDIAQIKFKVILFEHLTEATVLNWRYSFLLRLFK
jgi:hypothetical protein